MTTDNVILLDYASQSDSAFKLVDDAFTEEPYGIGITKGAVAFCEFIRHQTPSPRRLTRCIRRRCLRWIPSGDVPQPVRTLTVPRPLQDQHGGERSGSAKSGRANFDLGEVGYTPRPVG